MSKLDEVEGDTAVSKNHEMKVLDLFCGAGGSAMGIYQAGFTDITGIDINPQPEYPFKFIQKDISKMDLCFLNEFDFIWASPPCQAYSIGTKGFRNKGKRYPDCISWTREMLKALGKPFVLENVPSAPLRKDLMLCGSMFSLGVIRHRIFEIHGFNVRQPEHRKHTGKVIFGEKVCVSTACVNPGCFGKREKLKKEHGNKWKDNNRIEMWQFAMGIDHIKDRKMLAEAVPPSYSRYIMEQFKFSELSKGK